MNATGNAWGIVEETGQFRIGPLPAGRYVLMFWSPTMPRTTLGVFVLRPEEERTIETIEVKQPALLVMQFTGVDAKTAAGAGFAIWSKVGGRRRQMMLGGSAATREPRRVRRLTPGSYSVTVHGPGIIPVTKDITLFAGAENRVDFRLESGTPVRFNLRVPAKASVPSTARVSIRSGGKVVLPNTVLPNFLKPPPIALAPGRYVVIFDLGKDLRGEVEFVVPPNRQQFEVEVLLEGGG